MKCLTGALILLLSAVLAGCAKTGEAVEAVELDEKIEQGSEVIITVGERKITHDKLYSRLYSLFGEEVLSQMIEELLVLEEADSRGLEIDESEVERELGFIKEDFADEENYSRFLIQEGLTEEELKRRIRVELMKNEMVKSDYDIEVTENEIEDYFEENKERLSAPRQVRLAHILLNNESEAELVYTSIKAGADFDKMAEAKSEDEETAGSGGDIGYFSQEMLNEEISGVVFALNKGEVSRPVRTRRGWHVMKVKDITEEREAELDSELERNIRAAILNSKINRKYPGWIESIKDDYIK